MTNSISLLELAEAIKDLSLTIYRCILGQLDEAYQHQTDVNFLRQ